MSGPSRLGLPQLITPELIRRTEPFAWILAIAGGALIIIAPFLPWAYDDAALDDMSVLLYPSVLQLLALALGVVIVAGTLLDRLRPTRRGSLAPGWRRLAKAAATGALIYLGLIVITIGLELGGLVNIEPGGWIALAGGLIAFAGTRLLAPAPDPGFGRLEAPVVVEILAVAVFMGAAFSAVVFALDFDDGGGFVCFIAFLGAAAAVLIRGGVMAWYSGISARRRPVLVTAAILAAILFPFSQGSSDANLSIATQVIIFAMTALGLNIVVGLAGLLDLGYIAFLGAGAYVSAMLSQSAFATINFQPPFPLVILISGTVTAVLGLIIGSPTLRVSGDYLAIVTLAFGEIFRIAMLNLDGISGPDLTHGPNGIPAIPDLDPFGYDFGDPPPFLGIFDPLPRFANYYFLLLFVLLIVILIVVRLNNSRIGRGWVAIREDEKAAEAMGVNTFGLKLFAFAGGAFLAGVAGSIKAHHDISITPGQFVFLESAFLLSAVVLGGMGTVVGVLVGATLLKLAPEKLREFAELRLLLFGVLLIVMMRFRPEGIVPSRRRQLEFHEDDEELADKLDEGESVPSNEGARA
ncbi:branched-chain amino acid ABC transporter permease [Microlunatus speluncae]|uniref:branched-chain amino acid ABC transporter permease n=1 Tax=Microlunatus speluncae TaxID=2594267 RepID=UPI0012663939|nr:branched-chain amino acid ABC transporter permease [Microlunatus speluncae]